MNATTRKPRQTDTRTPLDLEALVVWAIQKQRADRDDVALHGVELAAHIASRSRYCDAAYDHPAGWPADSLVRLQDIATVGTRIDGGGPMRGVAPRLHPDAELVMARIDRITDRRRRGLVLYYGKIGGRPDWLPYEQKLVKVEVPETQRGRQRHKVDGAWEDFPERSEIAKAMIAAGRPIVDHSGRSLIDREEKGFTFRRTDDGKRQLLVRFCPVIEEPSLDTIRNVNDTYSQWHAGMMDLLGKLLGLTLQDHRVTGFSAPALPWDTASVSVSSVKNSLSSVT